MILKPYPYQERGIEFLTFRSRAILGDDPGIGKTVQSLMAIEDDVPVLIVVPGFAMGVWRREIATWRPDLNYIIYRGTPKQRQELIENTEAEDVDIVICTYAMMAEVQSKVQTTWNTIIFDEAHILRNRRAKTLYPVARKFKSEKLFLLTGTPVVNGAADLWTLLNLIDRKTFSSYWRFAEYFALVYENMWSPAKVVEGTNPATASELQELMKKYMLRRTAKQVGLELPETTRQLVPSEMTPRQRSAYKQMVNEMMMEVDSDPGILLAPNKLTSMTRLRQLLVSPELVGIDDTGAAIQTLIDEIDGINEPIVIFTPFAEALPIIRRELDKADRPNRNIQGGMNPEHIAQNIEWFADGGRKALVSTIQMGASWSATVARISYFLGFTFSVHEHTQAEARIHRHGQKNATIMKYLVHEGTIDEHIIDILTQKTTWQRLATDPERLVWKKVDTTLSSV